MVSHDDWKSRSQWECVLDGFAQELLSGANHQGGAVDAVDIALCSGLEVVFDASQAGRARIQSMASRPTIFVKPDDRPERLQWAVAHELGEANAHILFERLGMPLEPGQEDLREKLANEFASRLLLPTNLFQKLARECSWDVCELKAHFVTASHELIAWRMLDAEEACIITIFDHGRITRRRGNQTARPPQLLPIERDGWNAAHQSGEPVHRHQDGIAVQVWPVHIPGWRREILRTVPTEEFE